MLGIGSAFFRYEFRAVTIALFESLVLGNSKSVATNHNLIEMGNYRVVACIFLSSVVGRTVVAAAEGYGIHRNKSFVGV